MFGDQTMDQTQSSDEVHIKPGRTTSQGPKFIFQSLLIPDFSKLGYIIYHIFQPNFCLIKKFEEMEVREEKF